MGCGQSTDPTKAPDKGDNSVTPVEPFDASEDSPRDASPTSRQPRENTIALDSKKRSEHHDTPVTASHPVGSPGSPGFTHAAITREQALPNPFAPREESLFQAAQSPSPYTKAKDNKKRGGFDPERFRQANGRGAESQDMRSTPFMSNSGQRITEPWSPHEGFQPQEQAPSQDYLPHPHYIAAPEYATSTHISSPPALMPDFINNNQYSEPAPEPRLNPSDEQELENILQEIGDL